MKRIRRTATRKRKRESVEEDKRVVVVGSNRKNPYLLRHMIDTERNSVPIISSFKEKVEKELVQTRKSVISWIKRIHRKRWKVADEPNKFRRIKMSPKTLFLAVSIFDRFMCRRRLLNHDTNESLTVVSAAALWIATKHEDAGESPSWNRYAAIVAENDRVRRGDRFRWGDILRVEIEILFTIDFNLYCPTVYDFSESLCDRYVRPAKRDRIRRICAKTLEDAALSLHVRPSDVALACVALGSCHDASFVCADEIVYRAQVRKLFVVISDFSFCTTTVCSACKQILGLTLEDTYR